MIYASDWLIDSIVRLRLSDVASAGAYNGSRVSKAPTFKVKVIRSNSRQGRTVFSRRGGPITFSERRHISRSQARLNRLKRPVRRDGIVTRFDRRQVRNAQVRHNRLVRQARRW